MLFLVVAGVRVLVDAREKLHIPWGDPANQSNGDKVMAFDTRAVTVAQGMVETSVFLDYLPAIRALWADSGIQHAYDRRREFQLVRFALQCLFCVILFLRCFSVRSHRAASARVFEWLTVTLWCCTQLHLATSPTFF